jgi:outer membrane protein TolC
LHNPDLRAVRDQHAIADAQLLQAGLLPDPTVSYGFSAPSGGTDLGTNNAFGIGLSWEATALIWQRNKITAAEKQRQEVDLYIAWQEWQIAQAARLAAYQLIVYRQQRDLLREMAQRLEDNRARLQQAAELGLATELERVAAVSAKNLVDIRLLTLEQQIKQQRQRLNRAMGLKPHEAAVLQHDIALTDQLAAPAYEALIRNIENRRLDLMALKRGYESQDERLHIAVLQQFPKISIGFTHARDNSNLYTLGFGISMTLPLFDRNQGQVALERATRRQLFDQYVSRLFQARADIAELLVVIAAIKNQVESVRRAIPDLAKLVDAYRLAIQNGQVDVLNFYTAWNNLTDKKIDLLTLELQLVQAGIALEVASGLYHVTTDVDGKGS